MSNVQDSPALLIQHLPGRETVAAGLPALYTRILTLRELSAWTYHGYLLLYIVFYMLDDALIGRIVDEARELLARLGVEIHDESILSLLAERDAQVAAVELFAVLADLGLAGAVAALFAPAV